MGRLAAEVDVEHSGVRAPGREQRQGRGDARRMPDLGGAELGREILDQERDDRLVLDDENLQAFETGAGVVVGRLAHAPLKHDPEKWATGFRKRSCSNKEVERDDDSTRSHRALDASGTSIRQRRPAGLGGPLELVADAALDEAAAETGAGRLLDHRSAALAPVDGEVLAGAVAGDGPGQVEGAVRGRQGTVRGVWSQARAAPWRASAPP